MLTEVQDDLKQHILLERTMDAAAAKKLVWIQAEFRRLNLFLKMHFPYQTQVALQYDIGDYEPHLDKAMEMIDYSNFEKEERKLQSEECTGV